MHGSLNTHKGGASHWGGQSVFGNNANVFELLQEGHARVIQLNLEPIIVRLFQFNSVLHTNKRG
jgi:hypothetical protein